MISASQQGNVSRGRAARTALLLLMALNLLNYVDRYILPGSQSLIQREFGVSDEKMGALTTALFFTYMLVAPLTGWLGDRVRRKPLIVAGAMLWGFATLFTAYVHSYLALYLRHALVGVGEATFGVFAPAVICDFYPERERNRILSYFYLAIPVGAALGYVMGGQLGAVYGWRAPFLAGAVPALVLALLYAVFAMEPERGSSDELAGSFQRDHFLGLLRNPAFWTATLGLAMLTFTMGGISAWMPTFLHRFTGMSVAAAGTQLGAVTVIDGIAGTWVGGMLAGRWQKRNPRALYLFSAWSVALTVPFGAIVFFGPDRWAVPALFVAEFFLFLNTGPLNTALLNSVSARIRSTATALNLFLIHALGDTFSPLLIGHISDRSGLRTGLGLTLATMVISAGILFGGARFAPISSKGKAI